MARKSKYKEKTIMSSVSIPDSVWEWLEETSKKKGISKNSIVVASLMRTMTDEDIEKVMINMQNEIKKKQELNNKFKAEQEAKYIQIINKLIEYYTDRIKLSITNNSRTQAIETYIPLLTNKAMDYLIDKNIEYDKNTLIHLIERQLRKEF